MPETLLSMTQKVAQQAGLSGNITSVAVASGDAARVVQFVKEATTYLQNRWGDWRFLWGGLLDGVASANNNTIPIPAGHYRWDQDRLFFDTHTVCPILWDEFEMYSTMNDPGYPTQFVIMPDSTIRMFPPPDQDYNYSFSWYKESPELVNDNDQPLIPDRFRYTIINRALWLYAMYDDSAELAAKAEAAFNEWLILLEADQRAGGYPTNQSSGNHVIISAG